MNELFALGISYKTAPVELRERFALPEGRAAGVLRELVSTDHVHEAASNQLIMPRFAALQATSGVICPSCVRPQLGSSTS